MRSAVAALVAAVLLLCAISVPATAAPGWASIDVPETSYTVGDTVPFSYTYEKNLRYGESLIGSILCTADGGNALVASSIIARDAHEWRTGPTPSWDGTTQAECTASLRVWDAFHPNSSRVVATDTFTLIP